jgi:predicted RNase H-like HicB family nuclease
MNKRIYGYLFTVVVEKRASGYVAYAPGVGGVYEEGQTKKEAIANAYEAANAILNARWELGDLLTEDSPYLKVLREPPSEARIGQVREMPQGYIVTMPTRAVASS